MNTVEISTEIADQFIKDKVEISLKHMPYKEFEIAFPYGTFQTEEEMLTGALRDIGQPLFMLSPDKVKMLKEFAKDYINSNVTLRVKEVNSTLTCLLYDKIGTRLIEFVIIADGTPIVTNSNYTDYGISFIMSRNLTHIIKGVVHHLTSPKTVKQIERIKEKAPTSHKVDGKKQPIRYVYRTKYTFKNIHLDKSDRTFNRKTESWEVAGHWREYKSGKTVWINPYTKGTGRKENKILKITKTV